MKGIVHGALLKTDPDLTQIQIMRDESTLNNLFANAQNIEFIQRIDA
jgi:hypothetical protein